jgi:hypothetical protein
MLVYLIEFSLTSSYFNFLDSGRHDTSHCCLNNEYFYLRSGVNFINILRVPFSYESAFQSFSLRTIWLLIFLTEQYWHKSCLSNVDEIEYRLELLTEFVDASSTQQLDLFPMFLSVVSHTHT